MSRATSQSNRPINGGSKTSRSMLPIQKGGRTPMSLCQPKRSGEMITKIGQTHICGQYVPRKMDEDVTIAVLDLVARDHRHGQHYIDTLVVDSTHRGCGRTARDEVKRRTHLWPFVLTCTLTEHVRFFEKQESIGEAKRATASTPPNAGPRSLAASHTNPNNSIHYRQLLPMPRTSITSR